MNAPLIHGFAFARPAAPRSRRFSPVDGAYPNNTREEEMMDPSYLEDDGHSTPSPPPQPGSSRDQDHTEWLRKQRDIWQRHYQAIKWHYQIAVGNAQQPFEPPDEFREYQIRAHYHICRRLNRFVSWERQRKLWHIYTLLLTDKIF